MILNIKIFFCQNLAVLLVLCLLSGAFGAAPLTYSGGVIADTFPPQDRGLAITVYALAPLFAPVRPGSDRWWVCGGYPRLVLVDGDDGSIVRVRTGCFASLTT